MAKGANQKFKLYCLAQIMLENTDDEHYLTMPEILSALGRQGISAARKSVYEDLRDLEHLGIEVEGEAVGKGYHYHVVNRPFELPELKLLVDVVQASPFLTAKKSLQLIEKLEKLTSRPQGAQLRRQVRERLAGKTTVFAGPSGVGKSSLTNRLFPEAAMETGDISQKIKRGRHTTRHSELFSLGNGTYLMDTPGFSSMYIEDMEADELKNYFPEFSPWEDGCRFLGCVHMGEKVCGVKEAVAEGKIGKSRYENYRLMYQELKDKRRY